MNYVSFRIRGRYEHDSNEGAGTVTSSFKLDEDITPFGRYDSTDPDTDVSDNSRKQVTVGFAWPVADWHAKWAVELQSFTQQ